MKSQTLRNQFIVPFSGTIEIGKNPKEFVFELYLIS